MDDQKSLVVRLLQICEQASEVILEIYQNTDLQVQQKASTCIIGPLSLGRNMSSFRNLAILSLSSLIVTIIVSSIYFSLT